MNKGSIRFRAAAVFLHQGKILAHAVENRSDGKTWFIPPGGGIDYGESSRDALVREMKEELEWEIEIDVFLGAFESFHIIDGMEEHEISFIYAARPTDRSICESLGREIQEADGMKKFRWVEMEALKRPDSLFYPEGLLETVEANKTPADNGGKPPRLSLALAKNETYLTPASLKTLRRKDGRKSYRKRSRGRLSEGSHGAGAGSA